MGATCSVPKLRPLPVPRKPAREGRCLEHLTEHLSAPFRFENDALEAEKWKMENFVALLSKNPVRQAARRGIVLCPNYFLSEQALSFPERNLYAAHEIVQMVPLSGMAIYDRLLAANRWVKKYLPNSGIISRAVTIPEKALPKSVKGARWLGEVALRTPPGSWLERWEMNRKIRRFSQETMSDEFTEAAFSADYCKGHFDDHSQRTLNEFSNQWEKLAGQSRDKHLEK